MTFTFFSRTHGRRYHLNVTLGVAFLLVIVLTFALGFSGSQHSSLFLQGAESRAGGSGRMVRDIVIDYSFHEA
jgi:Ca2+/H+ antiporter